MHSSYSSKFSDLAANSVVRKSKKQPENLEMDNSYAGADSSNT